MEVGRKEKKGEAEDCMLVTLALPRSFVLRRKPRIFSYSEVVITYQRYPLKFHGKLEKREEWHGIRKHNLKFDREWRSRQRKKMVVFHAMSENASKLELRKR